MTLREGWWRITWKAVSYFPETPEGRASKRQFRLGIAILLYALAATAWPNLIWATLAILALGVPVVVVLALFLGRKAVRLAGIIYRWITAA